jgi:hypothetical protein
VSTVRREVRAEMLSEQSKLPEAFGERYVSWVNLRYLHNLNASADSASSLKRETQAGQGVHTLVSLGVDDAKQNKVST